MQRYGHRVIFARKVFRLSYPFGLPQPIALLVRREGLSGVASAIRSGAIHRAVGGHVKAVGRIAAHIVAVLPLAAGLAGRQRREGVGLPSCTPVQSEMRKR